ncbi:MAG: four helix bundle protein [Bacteroidales bacterium]|nr:four helix bundle protein [Bacteroidales bacterium]
MSEFRFESLDVWRKSIELDDKLFELSDRAENKRYYRYAEQLRAASMSISNNVAEGSGSFSNKDFANFLVIARKSVFECANILTLFLRKDIINEAEKNELYNQLDFLSKMITNLRKSLLRN